MNVPALKSHSNDIMGHLNQQILTTGLLHLCCNTFQLIAPDFTYCIIDYYAPSGPPIRPIESFNIQLESTGTQIESSKIAMPISA